MKLAGVTVLDFSQFMAGPMVTAMMADHGARVIKVEPPGGDPTRHGPRSRPNQIAGDSFCVLNRGKQSVVLDLKDPVDRQAALDLVRLADVVIESFRPGVADRLGIGYAAARALNPDVVYCSLSAFGQSGLLRDEAAHDTVVQGLAGAFAHDGEGRPVAPTISIAGVAAAQFAMSAILMGLLAARAGEGGDHIDISMHDAALAVRGGITAAALAHGDRPQDFRADTGLAMAEAYKTSDGRWLCLGAREPRSIKGLLDALGLAQFTPLALGAPGAAQHPLRMALAAAFVTDTQAGWLERLGGHGVGPLLNYAEALAHPHTASREMVLIGPEGAPHLNTPIRFASAPASPNLRVPDLGEDTEAVLRSLAPSEA